MHTFQKMIFLSIIVVQLLHAQHSPLLPNNIVDLHFHGIVDRVGPAQVANAVAMSVDDQEENSVFSSKARIMKSQNVS